MKITLKLFRISVIPTAGLLANIKLPFNSASTEDVESALIKRFGPFAPRFNIFVESKKSCAGIEVMSANLSAKDFPQAGLINCDPLIPAEIDRIDGALRSELERLGIPSEIEEYQWRWHYSVS